ncbi:hypothetical protein EJ08DRAFT_584731 [Tothia fuscella]|uniref:Uncharacterized protein n=1 Tax=Tothia fuscella TaxID=1048955 RepID=A0A9P4NVC5_9PEZI|nr:hypothetical protein EJ08DRAFT_584731 [Tothia fuscella]
MFIRRIGWTCCGHSYFETEKGYIGLGPFMVEPGDQVCVLFGGRVLYVLRPDQDGSCIYIGDAYVHGLMDGEAIEQWREHKLKDQMFAIR